MNVENIPKNTSYTVKIHCNLSAKYKKYDDQL